MSYKGMLRHRCTVKRLHERSVNGMPVHQWEVVGSGVPLFLDLNFIRRGKDPQWTPEAGRSTDRSGVAFFLGTAPVSSGDRIEMTTGPAGTFQLDMAVDEAWRPTARHHLEVFAKEVPRQVSAGQAS